MKFFAIRYFAIKSSYTLFPIENVDPKNFFIAPFLRKVETTYYGKKYTSRIINQESAKNYIFGYLLKSKDTHLIKLDYDLFNESEVLNWEKLFFIIDKKRQLFVCEQNSSVASPENVKNVLSHLVKKIDLDGYEIKLEFLIDEFAFWNIIEDSKGIYQIGFDLNAPNLFGGSKKANEWLKKLKEKHNMSRLSIDFRNDNNELKYDKVELESYRDYTDSGGGNWTLGILKKNNRKKKFSSANHIKTQEVDFDASNPNEIKKSLNNILNYLIDIVEKLDRKDEE